MKQFFTLFFSLLFLGATAQTCDGRYQSEIYTSVDVTTVDFGSNIRTNGDTQVLQMDIYQAVGDTATDRPVVIFCFGGSFVGGSRTSGELVSFATSFAKRGFVCASIDYRIAGSALELISEENMVKVVFSAVQDGKASIRYFRKNHDEGNSLGIDPDHIFIGGTSAGGILAINLAYVDSLDKLTPNWKDWAIENGGLEGNSGNPGFCSYPNGIFSFSGAVGDTSYINDNDVPFYSCHATGDQTVLYGYGPPLNGFAPVDLYGSGNIATRLTNLGVYNVLDTYTGSDHPPLNTTQRMNDTRDNLGAFLYNLLDCNASNMKNANQQGCESFYIEDTSPNVGISSVQSATDWQMYPNPATNVLMVVSKSQMESLRIYDQLGSLVLDKKVQMQQELQISLEAFPAGLYFVQVLNDGVWQTEKLRIK